MVDGPALPPAEPHILGIVVRSRLVDGRILDQFQNHAGFRGMCCSLEPEMEPETSAGLEELARRGIPLDVEMSTGHFPALLRLGERLPGLRLGIDHLARPDFRNGMTAEWARGMESAARMPQVFCKISGLLTEVEGSPWSAAPLRPFVEHALAVFGPARLMFGSEWPLRLPDVTWKESLAAFTQSIGARSLEAREQLLGGTARAFYGL